MPKATPATLRPYTFHGLAFTVDADEATAEECPFCGREGKFGVKVGTGQYHCFVCGADGNAATFLRAIHEQGTTEDEHAVEELRQDRNLLYANTIHAWGLIQRDGEWLFPAYGTGNKLDQLYVYRREASNGSLRRLLKATSEVEAALFGVPLFDPAKGTTYVTESWNAPTLWEALRIAKRGEDGHLHLTGSEEGSLLGEANVIGVPGANVWKERWSPLLAGQRVVLMIDSDHARKEKEKTVEGAGLAGAKRTAGLLANAAEKPASISWLKWGPDGFDPAKKSGWDVRDELSASVAGERVRQLGALLAKVEPIPETWLGGGGGHGSPHLQPTPCSSWTELVNHWKKPLRWSEDLEHMLAMMLASVISTETQGEQIWLLVMAPPSSGKTTICEALAVAREYTVCRSVLRSVFSGYKESKEDEADHGEIPNLMGKTLIVMDGDTLLKDPQRALILSQYRGLYDGVGRIKYNNGLMFNHEGIRFTKILCGTAAMRELDSAEVGARFVNCSFSDRVDDGVKEREVNRKVVFRALRNVKVMANGSADTRQDAGLTAAKRATGGYVIHLRRNAAKLVGAVDIDSPEAEAAAERVIAFGEFVAMLRARPPKWQDEAVEREMSHRLVEQFGRLTVCLAAVTGRTTIADPAVLERVKRAALDTARGRVLQYADVLRSKTVPFLGLEEINEGASVGAMAIMVHEHEDKVKTLLTFLAKIGVAERFADPRCVGVTRSKWRLTRRMRTLYDEVRDA